MLVGPRDRRVGELRLRPRRRHAGLVRAHRRVLHRVEDHDGALRAAHALPRHASVQAPARPKAASRRTPGGCSRITTPARRSTARRSMSRERAARRLGAGLASRCTRMSSIRRRYDFGLEHSWIQNVAYWPLNLMMHELAERKIAGAIARGASTAPSRCRHWLRACNNQSVVSIIAGGETTGPETAAGAPRVRNQTYPTAPPPPPAFALPFRSVGTLGADAAEPPAPPP